MTDKNIDWYLKCKNCGFELSVIFNADETEATKKIIRECPCGCENGRRERKMNKPKIRHCRNCQYHKIHYIGEKEIDFKRYADCRVKYKNIRFERLTALLCRHYKEATEEYK